MKEISGIEYPVIIADNLSEIGNYLSNLNYSKIFVLVDENTHKHCLPLLPELSVANIIQIASGEQNKTLDTCSAIWQQLLSENADRKSLLVNLGGGVIGDMGGFCASIFKRGIDFINIPTTLLAQVDATIGGKTGIDFSGQKNMLGLFSNPKAVLISSDFLKTLDYSYLRSGIAEILKHGLIADESYFNGIAATDFRNFERISGIIEKSIQIKKAIVSEDPTEKGKRKILNFGHTIGHAIESTFLNTKDELLHGEAVALGMIGALYLSQKLCGFPAEKTSSIIYLIKQILQLQPDIVSQTDSILSLILNDKKNHNNEILFVLLKDIAQPVYDMAVNKAEVVEAIHFIQQTIHE